MADVGRHDGGSDPGWEGLSVNPPEMLGLPARVIFGYVGLILATAAALILLPSCRPLVILLYLLMGGFFLFAAAVISLAFFLIFRTAWGSSSTGGGKPSPKGSAPVSTPGRTGMTARTEDFRDRWLDGI